MIWNGIFFMTNLATASTLLSCNKPRNMFVSLSKLILPKYPLPSLNAYSNPKGKTRAARGSPEVSKGKMCNFSFNYKMLHFKRSTYWFFEFLTTLIFLFRKLRSD